MSDLAQILFRIVLFVIFLLMAIKPNFCCPKAAPDSRLVKTIRIAGIIGTICNGLLFIMEMMGIVA